MACKVEEQIENTLAKTPNTNQCFYHDFQCSETTNLRTNQAPPRRAATALANLAEYMFSDADVPVTSARTRVHYKNVCTLGLGIRTEKVASFAFKTLRNHSFKVQRSDGSSGSILSVSHAVYEAGSLTFSLGETFGLASCFLLARLPARLEAPPERLDIADPCVPGLSIFTHPRDTNQKSIAPV